MKRTYSTSEGLDAALVERAEEEGVAPGSVIRDALVAWLGLSDAKPKKKERVDLGVLVQKSLGLPISWWQKLGLHSDENGYKSINHWFQETVRRELDLPVPPPAPPRAKRDPDLSYDTIVGAQAEMFDSGLRKLRSSPVTQRPEDWVEQNMGNPERFYQVCECFVMVNGKKCKNHLFELHKHQCKDLGTWVKWMRGLVDLDKKTGNWTEIDEDSFLGAEGSDDG